MNIRLEIIKQLTTAQKTSAEIADVLGLTQTSIINYLRDLVVRKVVQKHKTYYSLAPLTCDLIRLGKNYEYQ